MKLVLLLCTVTSIWAIRVPSIWQHQQQQQPNLNAVIRDAQPIREDAAGPTYNNINSFINNIPTTVSSGVITNGNIFSKLPTNYNNFFTAGTPNYGFPFAPPSNQVSNGHLLHNNNFAHRNGPRGKPFVQQRQGIPTLVQPQRSYNRNPVTVTNPNTAAYKQLPGQVPYITYTTQGPASQTAAFSTLQPVQNSQRPVNIRQAYPQVTSPKTAVPLTELDFSPRNPFPNIQQASTQINTENGLFSTAQPINNLDFSFNNPFPHASGYQIPKQQIGVNKPFLSVADNGKSKYNPTGTLRNLEFNPFSKNYRDHRTHEPTQYDQHYDNRESIPIVERLESEKAPVVENHEHPAEVPTGPIYPGEGQWAKPGLKHRPFISKQKYANLEEPNQKPDGYDTFLEGQNLFENQKSEFGQKLSHFPSHADVSTQQSSTQESDGEIFVPTRLYAQVRHSEDEKHLPPESDENGRLKELIKDTKIQTIYSEEGFEDSAYDHAGHEKKAENSEGFESDEKNEELKAKKRIPLKKYDRQSASYSIGDQNLKDEDIERNKKEEVKLENEGEEKDDSEPAGTHYEEQSYLNKIKPSKTKDGNKKAFIKSKEIKTVTATDKGGGKIEMEISSEVKAVVQPNNSTKFHKYVKIYPKINKKLTNKENLVKNEPVEAERRSLTLSPHEVFIEEVTNKENEKLAVTTVTPTEYAEIVTMEIPSTTLPTTAIPKLEANHKVDTITNKSSMKLKLRRRRRRSAPGIPEIEIDTDFIDKINHDIGKPTEKSNTETERKYPYYKNYKDKGLHEDSPLRYAEDIKNVPVKSEGKLAFYDLADRKMACPDVNPEVNPVPDRIENADEGVEEEEEDEEGNDPATKEPRLGQLGDKIDCFKAKYFGENPLDNPIFQEETVGTIKPIFSEIENISTKKIGRVNSRTIKRELKTPTEINRGEELSAAASNYDSENEIDDKVPYKKKLTSWFPGKNFGMGENTERDSRFVNHFVDKNPNLRTNKNVDEVKAQNSKQSAKEVYTFPPATLITTPKYKIDLKPKHIYDQIQLLEYLPDEELEEVRKEINADLPKINITEITTPLPNMNKTVLNPPIRKKKKNNKKNSRRKAKVLRNNEESMRMETSDNSKPESLPETEALQLIRPIRKKPLYEIFDINKYLPKVPKISFPKPTNGFPTDNPNYLDAVSIRNPTFEIFDINKYLPTTPFPLFKNIITQSTVLPKYKVISEVFYKEDIKPNEQLNVFRDVLNHIRSFPRLKDNFPESSQPVSVKLNAEKILEKYPQNFLKEDDAQNKDYFSSTITTIMTTFDPEKYASNHKYLKSDEQVKTEKELESMLNEHKTSNKPKRRRRIKTTTQETPMVIEESTSTIQYIAEPTEVMGLMPPLIQGYKTIYHPKRDNSQHISGPTIRIEERKINKYFVQGMKPPPKQKVYLYSDFLTSNHINQRVGKPKRSKRSAQRPAYAQLSRNKTPEAPPEAKKEEEDDYVPHRPRNYHYDEKTGKIVYDKKPQEQSEEEQEVEYIEVVEETPKTTAKPKQNPIFATVTPPPEGQSYTDFVKLLKSASNYHEIPDPTTTEKGEEEVTQKMVASTLQPVSTNPPEFLSILAKVRNDTTYKLIEDKKKTTTTSAPVEEEAESVEEESQVGDIRNSPGGQQGYDTGANLEIFDISDFLPNIKSYLPKTSVDTSKYKTIERPHLRHSISSRYNSEEETNLENVNTNKQPILSSKKASEKSLTRGATQTQPETVTTTTTSSPEITSLKPIRVAGRRRTTTARSVASEETVSTTQATVTNQESDAPHHDKARRNYRRRPTRIRVRPTTDPNSADAEDTTKIVRRRSERDSHMYADGNEQYEHVVDADEVAQSLPNDDYVDYEDITDNTNKTNAKISTVAKKVVDIFKNYDKDQKHGGNYKTEDEVIKANLQQNGATVPDVSQGKVKEAVEAFKAYDKTKKHGGNYKAENENVKVNEQLKPIITKIDPKDIKKIDIIKPYDETKKHGGNYKAINEGVTILTKVEPKDVKNVEVFKDYDKTKKHGGNYKPENLSPKEQHESELEKTESIHVKNVNIFQDDDKTEKRESGAFEDEKVNFEAEPILLKNVEVFKDYDKSKKHGGNYKADSNAQIQEQQIGESQYGSSVQNIPNVEAEKRSSVEVFKNYDPTKKHGGNYAREDESVGKEKLTQKQDALKNVEVFNDYDKSKKHGGNYKADSNAQIQEQQIGESQYGSSVQNIPNVEAGKRSSVEVFKNYDPTKKHGGNYAREDETVDKEKQQDALKNVEVFKDYDKTKKHGGNYKADSNAQIQEQQLEESQFGSSVQNIPHEETKKTGSVEIFKNYDPTKKHGGNYAKENESVDKELTQKQQTLIDKTKDIDVFKAYDPEKQTGGNYKNQEDANVDETHYSKTKIPQQKRFIESRNNIQRLADVVLKPEAFYSDASLPLDINALKIVKDLSHEELEEIADSAEVDNDDKIKDVRNNNTTSVVVTRPKVKVPVIVPPTVTPTKKPLFIKDPSKRLYYYAPI